MHAIVLTAIVNSGMLKSFIVNGVQKPALPRSDDARVSFKVHY